MSILESVFSRTFDTYACYAYVFESQFQRHHNDIFDSCQDGYIYSHLVNHSFVGPKYLDMI